MYVWMVEYKVNVEFGGHGTEVGAAAAPIPIKWSSGKGQQQLEVGTARKHNFWRDVLKSFMISEL